MQTLRFGMVGCGQRSDHFFKMAQAIKDVAFVATCASHLESAQRKGTAYGITAHFDEYETMMDEVELDAVFVTTPQSVHAEVCLAAFERGLHVLNEKPMATSFENCQAMVRAAQWQPLSRTVRRWSELPTKVVSSLCRFLMRWFLRY